jgi:hypothetical protein
MTIEAIPEAIEEVQLYTGAFGAEFGHANSALVHTILRTGGSDFNASLDYRTDDFASPGDQFLGTSSFGYRHAVATIGGPLGNKLRYFVAAQHNYLRNRTVSFMEPFRFDNLTEDGLSGRTAGEPLPGPLLYERNYLPHNWLQNNSVQGNFVFAANALSFYFQNQYRFYPLSLNLGLRYERIASDIPVLTNSEFDPILGFINESIAAATSSNHFLPRFGFALPLLEQTLFYGSFGKYIEPFIGFGFSTDPERQTKYELGLRQKLGERAEINGVFFSRTDKLSLAQANSAAKLGVWN